MSKIACDVTPSLNPFFDKTIFSASTFVVAYSSNRKLSGTGSDSSPSMIGSGPMTALNELVKTKRSMLCLMQAFTTFVVPKNKDY